jgi:vancomycin permeability regulator SanA
VKALVSEVAEVLVVFGAIVRADGTPSGALLRRIEGAAYLARESENTVLIVSGGVHLAAVSESTVMRSLLMAEGIPERRIVEDPDSADTLESVIHCARLVRLYPGRPLVTVCSDRYHMPRCCWLFRLVGIPARAGRMPSALRALGVRRWLYWSLREIPATIADTTLLFAKVLTGTAG